MIMAMLVGLASLTVLKRPDGKPWLDIGDVGEQVQRKATEQYLDAKQALNNTLEQATTSEAFSNASSTSGTIYKWQDKNGNWVYSDKPNSQGASQTHTLDPSRITVMAAEDTSILKELAARKAQIDSQLKNTSSLSPTDVKQLMMDAKNIQKLMDERTQKIDQAIAGNK
jgi:hypothetical protein